MDNVYKGRQLTPEELSALSAEEFEAYQQVYQGTSRRKSNTIESKRPSLEDSAKRVKKVIKPSAKTEEEVVTFVDAEERAKNKAKKEEPEIVTFVDAEERAKHKTKKEEPEVVTFVDAEATDPILDQIADNEARRQQRNDPETILDDEVSSKKTKSPKLKARDVVSYTDFVEEHSPKISKARNWAIVQGIVGVLASVFGIDLMVTTFPVVAPTLALGSALIPGVLAVSVGAIGLAFCAKNIVKAVRYSSLLKHLRRAYTHEDKHGLKLSRELIEKSILKVHKLARKLGIKEPKLSALDEKVETKTFVAILKDKTHKVAKIAKAKSHDFKLWAHGFRMKAEGIVKRPEYKNYMETVSKNADQISAMLGEVTAENLKAQGKTISHNNDKEVIDPSLLGLSNAAKAEEGLKLYKAKKDIKEYEDHKHETEGYTARAVAKQKAEKEIKRQASYEERAEELIELKAERERHSEIRRNRRELRDMFDDDKRRMSGQTTVDDWNDDNVKRPSTRR